MGVGINYVSQAIAAVAALVFFLFTPNGGSNVNIDKITQEVMHDIEKGIDESDLSDLIESDGQIHLNAPEIFDYNLKIVLENNEIEYTDELAEEIWNRIEEEGLFERLQKEAEERLADQRAYEKNPWGYYGINQSDFVE